MDFVSLVRATIKDRDMLSSGDRVLLGVSGGPDSMALWRVFERLRSEYSLELKVVYVDHRLRGQGAKAEGAFVMSMGEAWGTEVEVAGLSVSAGGGGGGGAGSGSAEARFRSGRMELLERAASDWGATRIALGHHHDDHIETVLISLIRGTGLAGLGGIPSVRGLFIRPLMERTRGEILKFLEEESVSYCRDPSNLDPDHLRNRVRHGLLPYLEADFNPSIRRVLGRVADICRTDDEALSQATSAAVEEVCETASDGEIVLDLKMLGRYNLSLKRRVVRTVMGMVDPGRGEVEMSWVEAVIALAEGDRPGGSADLGRGFGARREYYELYIGPVAKMGSPEPFRFNIPRREDIDWGGGSLRIEFEEVDRPGDKFPPQEGPEAWFNPSALNGSLTVRSWRPGDAIRPFASSGLKKLSDLFTDYKVPRRLRPLVPLVADEDGIIWVVGYRLADRVRVADGATRVLRGRVEV